MMKTRIAALVAVSLLAVAGIADAKLAKNGDTPAVAVAASGTAGMSFTAKTSELTVADDGTTVTVTVPLANLDTGVALRNQHMREKYLEVGKFPNATLKVARANLKFPADGATSEADAQGTLNIHGTDKAVTFHYKASKKGANISVTATAPINTNDFGVTTKDKPASYLGVGIKPDMTMTITFGATDS